ncbi:MAG: response regulator [Acidimicrobiia bacterium]|nr:response regulator [Acidimicrobiia bacterium]
MNPRIICVDDEPRVLKGLRRMLGRDFDIEVAEGGAEALTMMRGGDPFDVIVSDMRMPSMTGAQLLARVSDEFPDTVRVLLTGQSELDDAVSAVNDGKIFRFLTKPCPPEILMPALNEAVAHGRLIRAERELLEETVRGSVALLAEILAIRDPAAADRGTRLKNYVKAIAAEMEIERPWDLEVAATLSEIGYALVPGEIIDRWREGEPLTEGELKLIENQPTVASHLISNIPRLEVVAEMVGRLAPGSSASGNARVETGVAVITAASLYDRYVQEGSKEGAAVGRIRSNHPDIDPEIINAIDAVALAAGGYTIKDLGVDDLVSGLFLAADLYATDGKLLLKEGTELTPAAKARILQYHEHIGIREPVQVRLPV